MTFPAFFDLPVLVLLKTARAKGDSMIKLNARPDLRRLADHDASAVIDKKMGTNLRPRMNIDPGAAMRPLRHDARDQWHLVIKQMRHSISGDRLDGQTRGESGGSGEIIYAAGFAISLKQFLNRIAVGRIHRSKYALAC